MDSETDTTLVNLADLLQQRLDLIADTRFAKRDAAAHLEQLKTTSLAIFKLQEELHGKIPVRLQHFLEQSSYNKALAFILGM